MKGQGQSTVEGVSKDDHPHNSLSLHSRAFVSHPVASPHLL